MRRAAVILLILIVVLPVFSNSSAVILNEHIDYSVTDGKVKKTVVRTVKINTPAAYRTFGESFFVYNPDVTSIKILKSETVQPDGTVVNTPDNGIVLQSPYSTDNSPDFSFMRELMVSHTGLEPGCTVRFEYVIEDLKPFRTVIHETFDNYFPVVKKTVSFSGIDKENIYVNGDIQGSETSFSMKNIKPLLNGHMFSAEDTHYVAVKLSDPFQKVSHILSDESRLSDMDRILSVLEMNRKSTCVEAVSKLSDFLKQRMETIHIPLEESGWYVRDIGNIVDSGYISDIEKTLLCISVLKSLGFSPNCTLSSDYKGFLVNPGFSVNCRGMNVFDSLGESEYPFSLDGTPVESSPDIDVSVAIRLKEQPDGKFTGNAYVDTQGYHGSLSSLVFMGSIKDTHVILRTENSEKVSCELEAEIGTKSLNITNVFEKALHLNRVLDDFLYGNSVKLAENWNIVLSLTVEFSDNLKASYVNGFITSNNIGSSLWKWNHNGDTLTMEAELHLKKGSIAENEYDNAVGIIAPLLKEQNTTVLF